MAGPGTASSGTRKKTTVKPIKPSHSYLAALKAVTVRGAHLKAALPLELITQILDYLPPSGLIRCAQVSKRWQEMVYDDTRWIQKLRMMGVWNDAEARQRFEDGMKRKLEAQSTRDAATHQGSGVDLPGHMNGDALGGRSKKTETLFDAIDVRGSVSSAPDGQLDNALREMSMKQNGISHSRGPSRSNSVAPLDVLDRVKSVRGHARQEFGKIYAALAPLYFDLVQQSHTNARIFRTFDDPEQQAKMLHNFQVFARCDVVPECAYRARRLDSAVAIFENTALREFEGGYYGKDYGGRMKTYAHVLTTLNGGSTAVDMFIDKNPILQQKTRFGRPLACLENPTASSVDLKPAQSFFHALASSIDEQVAIMDRVFPSSVNVMIPLLDRVTTEVVGVYINPLFAEAHRLGTDTYTQVVAGVFSQSLRFVGALYPAEGSKEDFHKKVAQMVVRIFEPHVRTYLHAELENLQKRSTYEVESWEKRMTEEEASTESFFMANVNRSAAKRDFMTSFRKVIMMPVNVLPGMTTAIKTPTTPALSGRGTPILGQSVDRPDTPTTHSKAEAPTTELAAKAAIMNSRLEGIGTLFSIEVALNLVHAAQSSIERACLFVQLGGPLGAEARKTCQLIFVHLLQILGFRHIKSGFDKAVSHLESYNSRTPSVVSAHHTEEGHGVQPLVTFLELVNVGDLIQQMIDVFYSQQLLSPSASGIPLARPDDFLDPAVKEKKRFEQMLDERVAAGLNKGIDVLVHEVDFLLSTTQSPADYNPESSWTEGPSAGPSGAPAVQDIGPTQTAKRVVQLVESHTSMLIGSTEKTMLDVFNGEVSLRLFHSLCKHLKRQRVSTAGAVTLISDANLYFQFIATLKQRELLRYFRALRELAALFLVDGGDARELSKMVADTERWQGVFGVEEVLGFVERRADWYSVRAEVEGGLFGMGCAVM